MEGQQQMMGNRMQGPWMDHQMYQPHNMGIYYYISFCL